MTRKEMQAQLDSYYDQLGNRNKFAKIDRRFEIIKYNMAVPFYLTV